MKSTARVNLPYPETIDPARGPAHIQGLAEALDPIVPSVAQQAALAGTQGAPGDQNRYVTGTDARMSDQRVPTDGSVTDAKVAAGAAIAPAKVAGTAVITSDTRLTDARTPLAHAASHQEGAADDIGAPPIGAVIAYAGQLLPAGSRWDWADGGLIDRTQYATFMTRVGHAYNGGVDPGSNKVRKPDKRGRVPVGADNFGQGAAGRLPNSNRARGQNGGAELHAHTINAHTHGPGSFYAPDHLHGAGSLYAGDHAHSFTTGGPSDNAAFTTSGTTTINRPSGNHVHSGATAGSGNLGIGGSTGAMDRGSGINGASATPSDRGMDSQSSLQPYEVDNYLVRIA